MSSSSSRDVPRRRIGAPISYREAASDSDDEGSRNHSRSSATRSRQSHRRTPSPPAIQHITPANATSRFHALSLTPSALCRWDCATVAVRCALCCCDWVISGPSSMPVDESGEEVERKHFQPSQETGRRRRGAAEEEGEGEREERSSEPGLSCGALGPQHQSECHRVGRIRRRRRSSRQSPPPLWRSRGQRWMRRTKGRRSMG